MPVHEMSDGMQIFYDEVGEGTPLIFTSSGNATHAMWGEQVAALPPGLRTLTYDWRGTGRSERASTGYTTAKATEDLATLISEVIGEPAIAVGHGMGGHIALRVAHEHPELVSGLVVVSSGPWYYGEREGVAGGMPLELLEGTTSGAPDAYPDMLAQMTDSYLFHHPVSEVVRMAMIMQQLEWPLHVGDAFDADMREIDHRPYLQEITQPTLILHGRHDRKQRFEGAGVLADLIPNARLEVFEESAHCPHAEEQKKFTSVLTEFAHQVSAQPQ